MIAWLLIPGGILILVFSTKVAQLTGSLDFAERWFGSGGTYTFIKLFGLAMTIFAFMWVTGGLGDFLAATVGTFVPGF